MRCFIIITITLFFVLASCKKDSKNPSSGSFAPSYTLTSFPNHIGDTSYYYITQKVTNFYYLPSTTPPITSTTSSNFYSTVVADSILPNGIVGKIWYINGFPLTGAVRRLVYYDSTLLAYVFIPILLCSSDSEQPMILKMPLLENSSWVNTINNTKDTCKTTSAILYPYNGSSQLALQLIREPYYNTTGPATFKYYKYIIGDKGFYQIEYTNIDGYLGFSTTTEYKTTLIKTNF